jgi:hypothetical protein
VSNENGVSGLLLRTGACRRRSELDDLFLEQETRKSAEVRFNISFP